MAKATKKATPVKKDDVTPSEKESLEKQKQTIEAFKETVAKQKEIIEGHETIAKMSEEYISDLNDRIDLQDKMIEKRDEVIKELADNTMVEVLNSVTVAVALIGVAVVLWQLGSIQESVDDVNTRLFRARFH